MAKKKPVGTVIELANDYGDYAKNFQIVTDLTKLFGAPGTRLESKWWRRNVRVWRLTEHQSHTGSWIVRNEMHWVLRLYFRNPADAAFVKLKF